ncbi:hypothetical protein CU097_015946 [Rhizopus azygosporus]|uniref:Uncharacterized protein n=1 Tax=Rhizopus azygosporus TaxID=86630 RepID=A0A367KHK4_RHIAZ|nr:hypothetical protein CU097_015946 [Rhizopus azygosporus]
MQKSSITHFEQQLYEKISYLKDIMLTFYTQLLYFCGTATAAYNALWQFPEFRLGVYVFILLAAIPVCLFLLFTTVVVFITTTIISAVWSAFVITAIGFALVLLIPILIASALVAGLFTLSYLLYCYVIESRRSNTKPPPKYKVQNGELYHTE